MEHHFNVSIAEDFGIESAILINYFFFWTDKNAANERHLHDGRYWFYNSRKAMCGTFPYMGEMTIFRTIQKLISNELLVKGNYNEDKWDRTAWYAFTDKGLEYLIKKGYESRSLFRLYQSEKSDYIETNNRLYQSEQCLNTVDKKQLIKKENERDKSLSKENFSEDIFGDSSVNVNDTVEQEKTEKKKQSDDFFEECWIAYRRKGSKKKSKEYWDKLSAEDKSVIMQHIKAYVQSRDLNYQKDFERYLRDNIFLTIVVSGKNVVFDPTRLNGESSKVYLPHEEIGFNWNEHENCYMYVGCWSGFIPDGYKDDERPDGATVKLGNSQGTVIWSSEKKEWVLHK